MGKLIRHEPCPKCNSRDNLGRYDDGSAYCFGCAYTEKSGGRVSQQQSTAGKPTKAFLNGDVIALEDRGIKKETCDVWRYKVNEDGTHIATFCDAQRQPVAQKLRHPGKKFECIGNPSELLYGMWLWGNGKSITITEGEIDALSVSQAFGNKYAVVSLPNGAQGAEKSLAANYEYLDKFERIVLMFDMDKPGREAIAAAASVLPQGKVFVSNLPRKDANECIKAGQPQEIVQAYWQAREWRPDGIVDGADLTLDDLMEEAEAGFELPYPKLQNMMLGLRKRELTLLTAGSGIGKSSWAREIAYHLHQAHELSIANVFLEEQHKKTAKGYAAIRNNVPLGRLNFDSSLISKDRWQEALDNVIHKRMHFYNHFGSLESKNLLAKLRYFATVKKVDFIILDHISIVTSGVESSSEGERKDIDILMTRLASLVQETGVGILAIVHLKRAQGKSFNEGDQISLSDLRGSGSLEQLSFNVVALERDQQAEGEERDMSRIRVLKCRETGDTGPADCLQYDRGTGRLRIPAAVEL